MAEKPKGVREIAKRRAIEREHEEQREKENSIIRQLAEMRDWLMEHLSQKNTPITDHQPVASWSLTPQSLTAQQLTVAQAETVRIPITEPQRVQRVQPITGGIDMHSHPRKITQDHEQTPPPSALETLEAMVVQSLMRRCQEKIAHYFYTHNRKMPASIEVSALDWSRLEPHLINGNFPDTHVHVIKVEGLREITCLAKEETIAIQKTDTTAQNTTDE